MSTYSAGDKVILTHDSVAGQIATFREYWYDGQAAQVEFADGRRQIINLAYVRPINSREGA